jgi:hypothetical protein
LEITGPGPVLVRRVVFCSPTTWTCGSFDAASHLGALSTVDSDFYGRIPGSSLRETNTSACLGQLFPPTDVRGLLYGPTLKVGLTVTEDHLYSFRGQEGGVRQMRKFCNFDMKPVRYAMNASGQYDGALVPSVASQHYYECLVVQYGLEGLDSRVPTLGNLLGYAMSRSDRKKKVKTEMDVMEAEPSANVALTEQQFQVIDENLSDMRKAEDEETEVRVFSKISLYWYSNAT